MTWDPKRYEVFSDARLRPAIDLLQRVTTARADRIADLGCGSGTATLLLEARWPKARIVGFDSSETMLDAARARSQRVHWRQADLADWTADEPFEVVFSNAALHWLGGHDTLLPRLMRSVASGGTFAVQMPRNFGAPSHLLMHELALEVPYRAHLEGGLRPAPVAEPADYHRWLSPHAGTLDIWETEYLQILRGENPVADWTRSTWLAPLLAALPDDLREPFDQAYRNRVASAYPKTPQGETLFPFRRLFLVARAP